MTSLKEGEALVKAARRAITSELERKSFELKGFEENRGAFVTLHSYPEHELKGCIGFPEPIFPLNKAIVRAAKAAAFSDPRFKPVEKQDMDKIIIEVSVLTKPELIKVNKWEDYLKEIKIGEDGLVAESKGFRGLLLPQVAVEQKWNVEEFLSFTCQKAGLLPEAWKDVKDVKIYKFQAEIFSEKKPNGEVEKPKGF